MTDSLRVFPDEVTRLAREVETEGHLGGQARVTDVSGTWKDLTDNVNAMAANVSRVIFLSLSGSTAKTPSLVGVTSPNDRCCDNSWSAR